MNPARGLALSSPEPTSPINCKRVLELLRPSVVNEQPFRVISVFMAYSIEEQCVSSAWSDEMISDVGTVLYCMRSVEKIPWCLGIESRVPTGY